MPQEQVPASTVLLPRPVPRSGARGLDLDGAPIRRYRVGRQSIASSRCGDQATT